MLRAGKEIRQSQVEETNCYILGLASININ